MIDRERIRTTDRMATALDAVEAGIDAARPENVLRDSVDVTDGMLTVGDSAFDLSSYDDVLVLGGGNAAGRIASHLAAVLGPALSGGVVVTDDPAAAGPIEVVEGAHPVPSAANRDGTRRLLETARAADSDTLAVVAVTGGGSRRGGAARRPPGTHRRPGPVGRADRPDQRRPEARLGGERRSPRP